MASDEKPDLLKRLWEINHAMHAMSRRMEQSIGLTGPQRLVLRELARRPGLAPGVLAEALGVHPSTVTGLVDRLVERGLIERRPNPDDRRSNSLFATAAAKELLRSRKPTIETVVDAAVRDDDADVEAASRLLERLALALRTAADDPT